MKFLMIMLSGVALVNNQNMNKNKFEAITGTKAVEQYKIIPKEVIQLKIEENIQKQVVAKKVTNTNAQKKKKTVQKKKKATKKSTKKTKQTKKIAKKVQKKKIKSKKTTVKKTYVSYSRNEIQSYAHSLVLSYGWSEYDFECLVKLWNRESSWNPNAVNKKSGACGVPQSLPCSKMKSEGSDYRTNYKTQVRWGLKYIYSRYGSPANAWKHSQKTGWY